MKTTRYEAIGFTKSTEQDVYASGCIPETSRVTIEKNQLFCQDTQKDLIDYLMCWTGAKDIEDVQINACDEPGRIDIQVLEDHDGFAASATQIAKWKLGEYHLWLATYTFRVSKVTREPITLKY